MKDKQLNITIILSLYSSIELFLLEIKDKYRFENKLYINEAIVQIKKLDYNIINLINNGTPEDFECNTAEIMHEFNNILFSPELKAYYSFELLKKCIKILIWSCLKQKMSNSE